MTAVQRRAQLDRLAGRLAVAGAVLGIAGALSVTRGSHRAPLVLLGLGTLPFAIATWWSVATPLIALLIFAIGVVAVRTRSIQGAAASSPTGS